MHTAFRRTSARHLKLTQRSQRHRGHGDLSQLGVSLVGPVTRAFGSTVFVLLRALRVSVPSVLNSGSGMTDNELTGGIIGAAIEVHRCLGPGST